METTTIYKFSIFYDMDEEPRFRFVVAEDEDEALEKLTTHFELMHRCGFARPIHISEPTILIEDAII